ncbi:hypothetical protein Bpfe_024431, partial [Biomphalaria pfeifferi]
MGNKLRKLRDSLFNSPDQKELSTVSETGQYRTLEPSGDQVQGSNDTPNDLNNCQQSSTDQRGENQSVAEDVTPSQDLNQGVEAGPRGSEAPPASVDQPSNKSV